MRRALDPLTHFRRRRNLAARFERGRHLPGGRVAIGRLARERFQHDGVERAGDEVVQCARARHSRAEELVDQECLRISALKESPAGEKLPEDDAARVEVGLPRHGRPRELLGRHVRELSLDLFLGRGLATRRGSRDAEVEHARGAVDADEDVLGRDVTVDDSERSPRLVRCFVRGMETVKHVRRDRHRDVRRNTHPPVVRRLHQAPERFALDVLEHEKQLVLRRHDVERRDDVVVMNARNHPRFVDEAGAELGVLCELRMKLLDRNRASEPPRAGEPAEVDGRHPARRDLAVHGVAADRSRRGSLRGRVFIGVDRHLDSRSSASAGGPRAGFQAKRHHPRGGRVGSSGQRRAARELPCRRCEQ